MLRLVNVAHASGANRGHGGGQMSIEENSAAALVVTAFADGHSAADVSVALLQRLANSLVPIIGQGGYDALLFRAVHRASAKYPWLHMEARCLENDPDFASIRRSFAGQDPAHARDAGIVLLATFIGILMTLIGADLSTILLKSALCHTDTDVAGTKKESD